MKTNDKILKYISGLMQEREKEEFELMLRQSDSLQRELEEHEKVLSRIKDLNIASEHNAYFNNLLPKVRQRLDRKKKFSLYPKLAYALPVAAIIAYFVINPFSSHRENQVTDINRTISEIQDETKQDILGDIIDQETNSTVHAQVVSDSTNSAVLDKSLANELFQNEDVKANYLETDDLINSLSSDEQNAVYNSLLNKKIL